MITMDTLNKIRELKCEIHNEQYVSSPFGYVCSKCYNETLMKIRGGINEL